MFRSLKYVRCLHGKYQYERKHTFCVTNTRPTNSSHWDFQSFKFKKQKNLCWSSCYTLKSSTTWHHRGGIKNKSSIMKISNLYSMDKQKVGQLTRMIVSFGVVHKRRMNSLQSTIFTFISESFLIKYFHITK